jgi:hypothetical protein
VIQKLRLRAWTAWRRPARGLLKAKYMPTKSLKISQPHHRRLKIASLQRDMKLQEYMDMLLDWALSEEPVVQHLREKYFDENTPIAGLE